MVNKPEIIVKVYIHKIKSKVNDVFNINGIRLVCTCENKCEDLN